MNISDMIPDSVIEELEKIKGGKIELTVDDTKDCMKWYSGNYGFVIESNVEYLRAVYFKDRGFCGESPRFKTDQD